MAQLVKILDHQKAVEVRLNRPDVRNAFSPEMIAEITDVFSRLKARPDVRVITLTGEGSVFCAGADLSYMKESIRFDQKKNEAEAENIFNMFAAIADCPQPVVAAVQGAVYGGGMGLIAACDVVLSDEKTKFCFSEVKLGIAPAVISGFVLQKISVGHAAPVMLSGKPFSAQRALTMGLVHELSDEDQLQERLTEVTRDFLEAGPEAVRATKALIRSFHGSIDKDFRKKSIQLIAERRVSVEGQEGLKSFLEKREPAWRKS